MSSLSQFIMELVRDANEMDRLGPFEKRRMLERSVSTIRDLREQIGASQSKSKRDVIKDIQTIAASIEDQSDRDVSRAFLEAAGAIRALKILMDSIPQHQDEGRGVRCSLQRDVTAKIVANVGSTFSHMTKKAACDAPDISARNQISILALKMQPGIPVPQQRLAPLDKWHVLHQKACHFRFTHLVSGGQLTHAVGDAETKVGLSVYNLGAVSPCPMPSAV